RFADRITKVYLESTVASKSSILGSIIGTALLSRSFSRSCGPGRFDDSSDLVRGAVRVIVHHDGVEPRCLLELASGQPQTVLDHHLGLGPAAPEPLLEDLERRWFQEDEESFGHARPHLLGPLHVDLQDDVAPLGEQLFHRSARRSGPVADDLRPFQEGSVRDHPVEHGIRDEVVVDAFELARPRRPGRDGDGKRRPIRYPGEQPLDHGALPHPGGAGDDDQRASTHEAKPRYFLPNLSRRSSRCFEPSPRTRRLAEMSNSSMIFCARTLPTPGSDSRTVETFILPKVPSSPAVFNTSARVRFPDFSS